LLGLPGTQGRAYLSFNADGTFTTALVHNDSTCNTATDTRNGNGVEYGVFNWNQTTTVFSLLAPPVVDTNGQCGFADAEDFSRSVNNVPISRSGNTIAFNGGDGLLTFTAVESDPLTLVGAFVPEVSNGVLLVFHADGTFLNVETQGRGAFGFNSQERGCYSISGTAVTFTIGGTCRPDGFASYDFNGPYGIGSFGGSATTVGPWPFTIDSATTITLNGVKYKRTQPN
jgi:hypothetical protein